MTRRKAAAKSETKKPDPVSRPERNKILFTTGSFIGVRPSEKKDGFWLGEVVKDVKESARSLQVYWLEHRGGDTYVKEEDTADSIPADAVYCTVELIQSTGGRYKLLKKEKEKVFKRIEEVDGSASSDGDDEDDDEEDDEEETKYMVAKDVKSNEADGEARPKRGRVAKPPASNKKNKGDKGKVKIKKEEEEEDEEQDEDDADDSDENDSAEEDIVKHPHARKGQKRKIKATRLLDYDDIIESSVKKKRQRRSAPSRLGTGAAKKTSAKKEKDEGKEDEDEEDDEDEKDEDFDAEKETAAKSEKVVKARSAKKARASNGVSRATGGGPEITVDQCFESDDPEPRRGCCPYCTSRDLIRAVLINNMELLNKYLADETVPTLCARRCSSVALSALDYAVRTNNHAAIKAFAEEMRKPHKRNRAPSSKFQTQDTGTGSFYAFGHAVRKVQLSRGSKEGNNAFSEAKAFDGLRSLVTSDMFIDTLLTDEHVSVETVELLLLEFPEVEDRLFPNIVRAVRAGNRDLAAYLVIKCVQREGWGFNKLHREALELEGDGKFSEFRAVSVTKKPVMNDNCSPIHMAAINPDPKYLQKLLSVVPEINRPDGRGFKVVHYAAACEGPGPLELILGMGATVQEINNTKVTPLMVAAQCGRPENIKVILAKAPEGYVDSKDKSGRTALHFAAFYGHVECVQELLKHKADVNAQDTQKATPLARAASTGQLQVCKHLVEANASVDKKDKLSKTPLMHAVKNGFICVASYLADALKANINAADSSHNYVLHYASAFGWLDIVKWLIERKANVNPMNDWKVSPLAIAMMKGHFAVADFLLGHEGVDINVVNDTGMTLVAQACSEIDESALNQLEYLLVKRHARVDLADKKGYLPLHHLAESEWSSQDQTRRRRGQEVETDEDKAMRKKLHISAAKLLIENGADVNARTSDGLTALEVAVEKGNVRLARYLVENGAVATLVPEITGKKNNILHKLLCLALTRKGIASLLEMILQKTPDKDITSLLDGRNADGRTPLLSLLCAYQDFKPRTASYWEPNIKAPEVQKAKADKGFSECFKAIVTPMSSIQLSSGITADKVHAIKEKAVDEEEEEEEGDEDASGSDSEAEEKPKKSKKDAIAFDKYTPAHFLVLHKETQGELGLLLGRQPNLNVRSESGLTPLHLCIESANDKAALLLAQAGADPNATTSTGQTPLHLAAKAGLAPLVECLVKHGSNPNLQDDTGRTPLGYGVAHLNEKITSLLLDAASDPRVVDKKCRNSLHLRVISYKSTPPQSFEVEEMLIHKGVDVNAVDCLGRTAMHYYFITTGGQHIEDTTPTDPIESISSLCAIPGINIDVADIFGKTPLMYAAQRSATVSSLHMIQHGARLDAEDSDGNTPLGIALKAHHASFAVVLLQKGADSSHPLHLIKYVSEEQEETKDEKKYVVVRKDGPTVTVLYQAISNSWFGLAYLMLDGGFPREIALRDCCKSKQSTLLMTLARKVPMDDPIFQKIDSKGRTLLHHLSKAVDSVEAAEFLLKRQVPLATADHKGRTSLHYAAKKHHLHLCEYLIAQGLLPDTRDLSGASALHCAISGLRSTKTDWQPLVEVLVKHGASLNGTYRDKTHKDNISTTALIHIVRTAHKIEGEQIKGVEKILLLGADVKEADGAGRTPLMHAIIKNNVAVVNLLTDAVVDPNALKHYVNVQDSKGWSAVHYVVCPRTFGSFENIDLLKKLNALGGNLEAIDVKGQRPLDLAVFQESGAMRRALLDLDATALPIPLHVVAAKPWTLPPVDYESDAHEVLAQQTKTTKKVVPEVDPVSGFKEGYEVFVQDDLAYDVTLTKADIQRGRYGCMMFYRMQVIFNRWKDMYILWTRWGRIGDQGQYQRTPFSTKAECLSEFEKVFKQKTGNVFQKGTLHAFNKIKGRYRLVQRKDFVPDLKSLVKPFDFEKCPSATSIPPPVQKTLEKITDIVALQQALKHSGINTELMPLGYLEKGVFQQARNILFQLVVAIETKEEYRKKKETKAELEAIEHIAQLSNDFYELIPHADFRLEAATSIDTPELVHKKLQLLTSLDELNIAAKILLGAQLHIQTLNPLDYVLRAMQVQMTPVTRQENKQEYRAIEQYVNRTDQTLNIKLSAIYRIERHGEEEKFEPFRQIGNRRLLWHGTPAANLIGILSQGLRISPPEAPKAGEMFGKGVYFADMFPKSFGYCRNTGSKSPNYLLICDVALGRMNELYEAKYFEAPEEGTNSTKGVGKKGPDWSHSLTFPSGAKVPLGQVVDSPPPPPEAPYVYEYNRLNYNEYIVYNTSQIVTRYLVEVYGS